MLALGDTRDVLIKGYLLTVFNVCQEGFVVTHYFGYYYRSTNSHVYPIRDTEVFMRA